MEKMINEGTSLNVCQTVKVWWPYNNYKGVKLVPEEATKSIDTPQILKHLREFHVGYNVTCIRKPVQKEINVSTIVMAQPDNGERTKGWPNKAQ